MGHTLIVEDDEDAVRMISLLVAREGHGVATAHSIHAALWLLAMQIPDLVLLITGQASAEKWFQALRLGAADYLVKPIDPSHLRRLLSRLIRPLPLLEEAARIPAQWCNTGRFDKLIGASDVIQRVYRQISRAAGTAVSVFLHGKSGTGKELAVRAVHDLSPRREQGGFTGAERQHQGIFECAHGGTLFFDEVTEMPLDQSGRPFCDMLRRRSIEPDHEFAVVARDLACGGTIVAQPATVHDTEKARLPDA